MQDINLALRETLKNFMNNFDYTTDLKYRWQFYRKASDTANSIQIDDKILDTEWSEIINMKSANTFNNNNSNQNSNETSNDNINITQTSTGLDKSHSVILNNNETKISNQSLVYLEDIHIFALANLLYRTIIVISLDTIRNIQPIHLRGIYLPLMRKSDECVKDPILIAFHNFHFMPLLFPIDEENRDDNTSEFINTEKYFHFENIDEMELKDLDNNDYETYFKFNQSTALNNSSKHVNNNNNNNTNTNSSMSNSCIINPGLNAKRKKNRFSNSIPLFYYNLEPMKIHFLKESEEKKSNELLSKYLNLIQLEIVIDDLLPNHYEFLNENHTITVLCCYLQKEARGKRVKSDGITMYLNFLNESIKKNGYKVASSSKNYSSSNDESTVASPILQIGSNSPPPPPLVPPAASITPTVANINDNFNISMFCKSENCVEQRMESNSFLGYCSKCFKKYFQNTTPTEASIPIAPSTPLPNNNKMKKEIEADKETQQSQFYSSPIIVNKTSTEQSKTPEKEIPMDHRNLNMSSKSLDLNKKLIVNRLPSATKLELCSSPKCHGVVQNLSDTMCNMCRESAIADAIRSTSANTNNPRNKVADRQTSSNNINNNNNNNNNRLQASNSKNPIQIPVRHEQTNNKISGYNLMNESKLYNTSNMLRSAYDEPQISYPNRPANLSRINNLSYLNHFDHYRYPQQQPQPQPQASAAAAAAAVGRANLLSNINDPFNNFQTRNNFQICSNCKNRITDGTGVSSFCTNCRMGFSSKIYF